MDGPGPADLIAGATEDPEQVGYDRGRVYVYANSFATTDVPKAPAPSRLAFIGPKPNPASGDVNLVFELDHAVPVRVSVYDLAGHEVSRPVADEVLVGTVTRAWRPEGSRAASTTCALGSATASRWASWSGSAIADGARRRLTRREQS